MATVSEVLQIALNHHQAGRLQEAEHLYREILFVDPQHPDALHYLGLVYHQTGKEEEAIEYIERAIILMPDNAHYHNTLGVVRRKAGRL